MPAGILTLAFPPSIVGTSISPPTIAVVGKIPVVKYRSFLSLVNVDISLFETAYKNKVIGKEQLNMLESFYKNPDNTMKQFLIDHPDFLKTTLQSGDEKTVKRAKLLINENLYGIF